MEPKRHADATVILQAILLPVVPVQDAPALPAALDPAEDPPPPIWWQRSEEDWIAHLREKERRAATVLMVRPGEDPLTGALVKVGPEKAHDPLEDTVIHATIVDPAPALAAPAPVKKTPVLQAPSLAEILSTVHPGLGDVTPRIGRALNVPPPPRLAAPLGVSRTGPSRPYLHEVVPTWVWISGYIGTIILVVCLSTLLNLWIDHNISIH